MAIEITMPQLSDTMDEGTILSWFKKEGESVSRGDALAEVATDKADLEIESFHEGVLLKIHSPEGTTVKVGSIIAVIGEAGEEVSDTGLAPAAKDDSQVAAPVSSPQTPAAQTSAPQAPTQEATPVATNHLVNGSANRVKISPLAKNLAKAHGVDYQGIQGSGDGGRIVKRDIEGTLGTSFSQQQVEQVISTGQAVAGASQQTPGVVAPTPLAQQQIGQQPISQQPVSQQQAPSPATLKRPAAPGSTQDTTAGESREMLSKMRQTIAQRMVESVNTAPHFYATTKVHADAMIALRKTLKPLPQYEGITFNHLVIKAAGMALSAFPRINSAYSEGAVVQPSSVNIGIITALPDGLLIPILKSADAMTLADIVQESNNLIHRARSGRPKADDLQGGTFSISNIGKADVESFTAIINPGQGAILAVSSMQQEPIVQDGALAIGSTMRLTLSVDHRIIDGVIAGQFVTELKRVLEEPALLLA